MAQSSSCLFARACIAVLALLGACAAPLQEGGVVVRAGAPERLRTICRWRHGDVESSMCGLQPTVAPARVRRIARPADRLSGPLAIGRDGDYLLENDEVLFVVDQLGRGSGFAESGGNLVDAGDARVRRDELGQLFTYFGSFPRQAVYDKLESGVDRDGTAWIRVSGHELYEGSIAVATRYALSPGARALVVETELENRAATATEPLALGDVVEWGAAHKIAPGKPLDFKGDSKGAFVAGVGASVTYVLAPVSADGRVGDDELTATSGAAWTNASSRQQVSIAPGERARYARIFVVAPRGDTLGVETELFYLRGGTPGGIEVLLVDPRGAPVPPSPGMRVLLGSSSAGSLWMRGRTLAAEAPPGHYVASLEGGGRTATVPVGVDVREGDVAKIRLAVTDAARLRVRVEARDAVVSGASARATPAKVQIFDAATGARVGDPILTKDGGFEAPIAAGRYRLVASRGPEYTLGEATIEVAAGAIADTALGIERVVDTRGYLACDFHQHTAMSADSGVSMADRAISNVSEGVECAASSEHNSIVEFAPVVRELGLEREFRSIVAEELTTDASREPFGHANAFPMPRDATDPRGGALPVRDRTAKEVFDAVRALPGERIVQVNHPRAGRIGYFDQLGFDRASGRGTGAGYDERFDALEVWSGRHVAERPKVLDDFWALLKTSHPVTPTANTDTHGIVDDEPGYPRTYVGVADDDPARLEPAALVTAVKRDRRVVVTNGPFVTLRLGEIVEGGLATVAAGRSAELVVTIERAPWVDTSELVLVLGGDARAAFALSGGTKTAAGAMRETVRIPVRVVSRGRHATPAAGPAGHAQAPKSNAPIDVEADTFVAAIVVGKKPLEPVLHGEAAEILPFAMTSPIWIDADGDGHALGR